MSRLRIQWLSMGAWVIAHMAHAAMPDAEWPSTHGGLANQRYVALDQINTRTVSKLGAVWISEPFEDGATSRMTPLMHQGRMFFAAGPRLYALDARSGKVLWAHQTESRKATGAGFEAMITGLAITRSWGLGVGGGKVFVGMMNGHILTLDERTGERVWDELINPEPLAVSKGITCPPLYVDGVLYLGFGQETTEGHAVAVDAQTGHVIWRVPTVAEPGQPAHETWPENSEIWRSGGGHPWVAGAADRSLGLVYVVTGNAGPGFGGAVRRGDNLYTASLIALEMRTGRLKWYRQLVHHDVWEADLSVSPVLYDRRIGGRMRRGVAVMRADGYLFLFDRLTGEPLVPIDERPVPQNPALFTAATQPFPRGGESLLPPCESFRDRIPSGFVLGCMFDPPSREVPNRLGQWASVRLAPMSYSPQTGLFYAQGANSLFWRSSAGEDPYIGEIGAHGIDQPIPHYPTPTAIVAAIDPRSSRIVWRKVLPDLDGSGYKANGGALSTAGGLVFHQGGDGTLQAYDAKTGETLWRFQTDYAGGDAAPMSYALEGRQYVAFIAGTKVWAFALGGNLPQAAAIPLSPAEEVTGPIEDTRQIEAATLQQAPANGHRYRVSEYAFNPYRARVRVGESVTFINNGQTSHTIVARDGSWTTGTLGPTQIATLTFDKPGRYVYFTKEYPWSYGQLIVVPASAAAGVSGSPSVSTSARETAVEQVTAGKAAYGAACAACHGETLGGRDPAPSLAGRGFLVRWAGRDALALFERMRTTMPPEAPGSLGEDRYAAVVSFILAANEHAPTVALDRGTMQGLPVSSR